LSEPPDVTAALSESTTNRHGIGHGRIPALLGLRLRGPQTPAVMDGRNTGSLRAILAHRLPNLGAGAR
jgi:hypothetical protein